MVLESSHFVFPSIEGENEKRVFKFTFFNEDESPISSERQIFIVDSVDITPDV